MTQKALASQLGHVPGAVSQWEGGRRSVDAETIDAIDRVFGANHALSDLAFAIDTPTGLPPSFRWWHNFSHEDQAVWAWLRVSPAPVPSPIQATITWGPWRAIVPVPPGEGIIVTSPVAVPNPAPLVQLSEPGWVDFGRGVPPSWLPIPMVEATQLAVPTGDDHDFALGLVSDRLKILLKESSRTPADLAAFLHIPVRALEAVIGVGSSERRWDQIKAHTAGVAQTRSRPSGKLLYEVRRSRHLSLRDVERRIADLPGAARLRPITLHSLRTVESDREPNVEDVLPRLDTVYRCGGALTHHYVFQNRQASLIREQFPPYWVGPVWLEIAPVRNAKVRLEIRWGGSRRPLELLGPTVVSFRQPWPDMPSVEIACMDDMIVSGGLGVDDDAVDINANWIPDGASEAMFVEETLTALAGLGGHSLADLYEYLSPR